MSRNLEITPIDFKAGEFTYGQRIELSKILADPSTPEARKFIQALECAYPGAEVEFSTQWLREFERLIDGVRFWADKEETMLHYDPTADEIAAGINDMTKRVGPMSTVIALASKFSQDPDAILEWKYAKVFGLLFADLESYKFQRRYSKVMEQRYKAKRNSKK